MYLKYIENRTEYKMGNNSFCYSDHESSWYGIGILEGLLHYNEVDKHYKLKTNFNFDRLSIIKLYNYEMKQAK